MDTPYRAYFPEFFVPSPAGELLDFAGELGRLRAADPGLVRLEFAIPLIGPQAGGGETRDPAVLEDPAVRRRLRERAAAEGDEALAGLLLDDPGALLERFLALLERYLAAQLVVVPGTLVWLYRRAPGAYLRLRNTVLATWLLSLPAYALFPVAPPRPADIGMVDTIATQTGLALDSKLTTAFYNPLPRCRACTAASRLRSVSRWPRPCGGG